MKMLGMLLVFISSFCFAGEETPWPSEMEQELRVEYLSGIWESLNIDDPHLVYDIRVESTSFSYCPYILSVAELEGETGRIMSHGTHLSCQSAGRVTLTLYDGAGRAKKRLKMVGLNKSSEEFPLSHQYLGLILMDFNEDNRISADIFYKKSE